MGEISIIKAKKDLEEKGYEVFKANSNKLFKLFDIFAIKNLIYAQHEQTLISRKYIQVKHQKPPLKPFEDFKQEFCGSNDDVEVWIWRSRSGFEKIKIGIKKGTRDCIVCGGSIPKVNRIYCSEKCSKKNYQARQKEKMLEEKRKEQIELKAKQSDLGHTSSMQ